LEKADIQWNGIVREQVAQQVEDEAQHVWNHGHEQDELGELLRAPCALEVATAVEDGEARDDQPKHILLHHRRQREDPRVDDGLPGHDGQVGHAVAHAYERLLDLLHPVGLRAQGEVEQREDDEAGEQAASQRRQIYSCHGGR
jgi:hypothetical protein